MVWNIAAGIMIAGMALGGIYTGGIMVSVGANEGSDGATLGGFILAVAGLAVCAWVIFFKAHFQ